MFVKSNVILLAKGTLSDEHALLELGGREKMMILIVIICSTVDDFRNRNC